jgi:hypothetical protein
MPRNRPSLLEKLSAQVHITGPLSKILLAGAFTLNSSCNLFQNPSEEKTYPAGSASFQAEDGTKILVSNREASYLTLKDIVFLFPEGKTYAIQAGGHGIPMFFKNEEGYGAQITYVREGEDIFGDISFFSPSGETMGATRVAVEDIGLKSSYWKKNLREFDQNVSICTDTEYVWQTVCKINETVSEIAEIGCAVLFAFDMGTTCVFESARYQLISSALCSNPPDCISQREIDLMTDTDNDGLVDAVDNCPEVYNPGIQNDTDADGIGDACDQTPFSQRHSNSINDADNDGIIIEYDNCPNTFNPGQEDENNNGVGDACDSVIAPGQFSPPDDDSNDPIIAPTAITLHEVEPNNSSDSANVFTLTAQKYIIEGARNNFNDEDYFIIKSGRPYVSSYAGGFCVEFHRKNHEGYSILWTSPSDFDDVPCDYKIILEEKPAD